MSTNHDVYKLSPILLSSSNESRNLKIPTHTWTSSCNNPIVSDTSSNYMTGYFTSNSLNTNNRCSIPFQQQSSSPTRDYLYEHSNILQSLRKINSPNMNAHSNTHGDPLDYSMHSSIDNLNDSVLKLNQLRSDYIHSSVIQNNQGSTPSSSFKTASNSPTNTEVTGGRLLKRKYSKTNSNLSKKCTGKQFKTETKNMNNLNHCQIIESNTSCNHDQLDDNQLITTNGSKEICLLTDKKTNSLMRRKNSKINKDLPVNSNDETVNASTMNYATSTHVNNTSDNDYQVNTNSIDNKNLTKKTNDSRAAYKYLTWREKDRRRRFREEWKHLWLVIPYGLYEVMCLVCHKVMTQRKVDTIKRHTVRRHVELLGMSDSEKEKLFNQLIKRYNMLEVANYNSSTDVPNKLHQQSDYHHQTNPTKDCNELLNMQVSNEVTTRNFTNTNTYPFEQHSVMNCIKNINKDNNGIINGASDFQNLSTRKGKPLGCRPCQTTNINSRYSRKFCPDKYISSQEVKQSRSFTENLKGLPANISTNCDNPSRFEESWFPVQRSLTDTSKNHCNTLEYPHIATSDSKVMPSKLGSVPPSLSQFSTTIPISKCSSCTYPSDLKDFHNFSKSYTSMNFPFSPTNIPTSSISSLFIPEVISPFNNPESLSTSLKSTSHLCTNSNRNCHIGSIGHNNRNNNFDISTIKSNQNYQLTSIEKQTMINEHRNRSSQKLVSAVNTEINLTNDVGTTGSENRNTSHVKHSSSENVYEDSPHRSIHSQSIQSSSNQSIPGSLPFMMSTFITDFLNHETDGVISPKTSESKLYTPVAKRNSVHISNPEIFNNSPNNQKTPDEETNFISRKDEKFTSPSRFDEQTTCPSRIKSNSKSKSNSISKQFTISSLLNIENMSSENESSSPTYTDRLIPDIQRMDRRSLKYDRCNRSTESPQEKWKREQPPTPCVLCNLGYANTCTNEVSKQFVPKAINRIKNDALDISPTKQIDLFRHGQSAISNPTLLPNASVNCKLFDYNTGISEIYQPYSDIFQTANNFLSNSCQNLFYNQNLEALGNYMKLYYLQLLRHQYDIPNVELYTQRMLTKLGSFVPGENELASFKK